MPINGHPHLDPASNPPIQEGTGSFFYLRTACVAPVIGIKAGHLVGACCPQDYAAMVIFSVNSTALRRLALSSSSYFSPSPSHTTVLARHAFTCKQCSRSVASASPPRFFTTTRMLSTLPRLPIFEAIAKHDPASTAVVHSVSGRSFTYGGLLGDVQRARDLLVKSAGKDLNGERIAYLVENSYDYIGAVPMNNTEDDNGVTKLIIRNSNTPCSHGGTRDRIASVARVPRTGTSIYPQPEPSINLGIFSQVCSQSARGLELRSRCHPYPRRATQAHRRRSC